MERWEEELWRVFRDKVTADRRRVKTAPTCYFCYSKPVQRKHRRSHSALIRHLNNDNAKTRNLQPVSIFSHRCHGQPLLATSQKHSDTLLRGECVSEKQARPENKSKLPEFTVVFGISTQHEGIYGRGLYLHISEIFIQLISQHFSLEMEPDTFKFLLNASWRIKKSPPEL